MASTFSRLKINSIIKAVIIAEMLLWSGWNFIMPIFSIYIVELPNGSIEKAATSFSIYLFARVIFGLLSGKLLNKKRTRHKFFILLFGMSLLSISYLGLAFSTDILEVYFFYAFIGFALGIASPVKNSLFSNNIKEEKATLIWGALDAGVFLSMAVSTIIGGVLVTKLGFQFLFFLAASVNLASIVPYLLYMRSFKKTLNKSGASSRNAIMAESCDEE